MPVGFLHTLPTMGTPFLEGHNPGRRAHDLLITDAGLGKIGGRGNFAEEAGQIPRNAHLIARNQRGTGEPGARRSLIGRTDGGRALTLVIEQTVDPGTG